jgi:alkyl sulfatase BDS1-like metallo-beta-lactamase superfamily hydrolase
MDLPKKTAEWRKTWAKLGLGPAINGHPLVVFQEAQVLFGRGEYLAAEGAFREVVQRDPRHLAALRWLANLVENRGLVAEAASYRQRYLELEAEQADVQEGEREMEEEKGKEKWTFDFLESQNASRFIMYKLGPKKRQGG